MKVHQVLIPLALLVCGGATLWWKKHDPLPPVSPDATAEVKVGRGLGPEVPRAGTLKVELYASASPDPLRAIELLLDGKVVQTVSYGPPYPTTHLSTYEWIERAPGPHTWQARIETRQGRKQATPVKAVAVLENTPPSLELGQPQENAVYPSDKVPLYFGGVVKDAEGAGVRVDFFLQGEQVGTATKPPYQHEFPALRAGSYEFKARATDPAGAVTEVVRKFTVRPSVPYAMAFTPEEGFQAGPLRRDAGWTGSQNPAPEVVAGIGREGKPAVRLPPVTESKPAWMALGVTTENQLPGGVIYHDVWLKPVADEDVRVASRLSLGRAELALLRTGGEAEVQANRNYTYNNQPIWRRTYVKVPVNENGETRDWLRLTVRSDMKAQAWDLYVNGRMVLHDMPQDDAKVPELRLSGHRQGSVLVGRVVVQAADPLFNEGTSDGIERNWTMKYHLLGGRARRLNDTDADGLLDIDEYIWRTDPRNPDTDGDGAPDGYEVRYGMDPLKPLSAAELASDEDHDGISLAREIAQRTPPIVPPPGSEWLD